MVIPITPKQSKRINILIKKLCCNYMDGSCLLLDDGEEHACVQCISRYGIYCNYFKNAVLPADRELLAEIMQPSHQKRCQICKSFFVPKAKNQRYCMDCAAVQKRKKAAERQRRKRAGKATKFVPLASPAVSLRCIPNGYRSNNGAHIGVLRMEVNSSPATTMWSSKVTPAGKSASRRALVVITSS